MDCGAVSAHNQGSVAAYPSIYKGCHWGTCTPSSGMPIRVSSCGGGNFNYSVSSTRPSGTYNVAAEAWLSPNTDTSGGYNGGAEIMIVLDYHGMYPAGSQVGTFNGHDVYFTNVGWNFVTYVLTGRNSASGNMMDFINDAVSPGYVVRSWYIPFSKLVLKLCQVVKDSRVIHSRSRSAMVAQPQLLPPQPQLPPAQAQARPVPAQAQPAASNKHKHNQRQHKHNNDCCQHNHDQRPLLAAHVLRDVTAVAYPEFHPGWSRSILLAGNLRYLHKLLEPEYIERK